MAAVARLRYDPNKKAVFDGKIGIWPFVYKEPVQRNSKNRVKGIIVTKNIQSINKDETRNMIINKQVIFVATHHGVSVLKPVKLTE